MQLPADGKVEFVKLHDALTTLRTHSKQVCCSWTSLWMASQFLNKKFSCTVSCPGASAAPKSMLWLG